MRLLLIEDNPDDVVQLRAALEDRPWEWTVVERLEEALELIQGHRDGWDLILLDLRLPDTDGGLEGLQRLFAAGVRIPVVVLTGVNDPALPVAAMEAGASDYLVKGSTLDSVRLQAILARRARMTRSAMTLIDVAERLRRDISREGGVEC